ncbi:MAG: hypothetical protein HYX43_10995 [Burkholderiales bacterium]|nr:hypothetical protein [Burkholderiales bacterium]
MDAADTIRYAVARVTALRQDAATRPDLHAATLAVKSFQAQRFAGTYADLLASTEYAGAARFFLDDLYSDKDYSLRDAQFARIAGGLQRLFPKQVVATAVTLAELHVLTEELDRQMAEAWIGAGPVADAVSRYMACWQTVGRESDRDRQLEMVLQVGSELDRLTRTPGLRMMLRMMRKPAAVAGVGALQIFLESGFDIFAQMSGKGARAREFLGTIQERESGWIRQLSTASVAAPCEVALRACLAHAQ